MEAALYARVSTTDQQTLPMQLEAMRKYAAKRVWKVKHETEEIGSGAKTRPKREELLKLAWQRKVDVIIVWRLDRWGRSLADLVVSLRELTDIGVGFVSLTETLDLTTPSGRAMDANQVAHPQKLTQKPENMLAGNDNRPVTEALCRHHAHLILRGQIPTLQRAVG